MTIMLNNELYGRSVEMEVMCMKKSKVIISLVMSVILTLGCLSVSAANISVDNEEVMFSGLINNIINSFNNKDYKSLINCADGTMANDWYDLFLGPESASYEKNNVGFWSIDNIELKRYKLVSNDKVPSGSVHYDDYSMYYDVKTIYIGLDIEAESDSADIFSGSNYFIWVLGKKNQDGQYKILQWSQPIIREIENAGIDFGDGDENLQKAVQDARINGKIIDGQKKIIEDRSKASIYSENSVTPLTVNDPDDCPIPSTIRVKLSSGTISYVNFYDYVKNVLPNEWIASADPMESLKAGAMCVKMYGWYRCYNYKYYGNGYDVKDTTADQVYKAGTEHSRSTEAINAVGGIGLKNTAGLIFETQYTATATTANGGKVGQNKANTLANQGYTWHQICNYFYSYSDKSTGDTATFRYY